MLAAVPVPPSRPMPRPAEPLRFSGLEPRRSTNPTTVLRRGRASVQANRTVVQNAPAALAAVHPGQQPGVPLPAPSKSPSRFAGSGWLIARRGGATPFVPQLGGSQAGVRLTYAIDPARRLSLAGRISTALASRQSEAAIGLDWKPTSLPLHLVAEQRIGVDRARGGPSLGLIGGFGPVPVTRWLLIDGYAQGGGIVRDGIEGFVDGAVRLSHPIGTLGASRIELGLAAWGAAQRGAARLDAGPTASAILPIAGKSLRVSLEWRQRLAGRATPASGPALSIGTDF
jgi:hypothetical protein